LYTEALGIIGSDFYNKEEDDLRISLLSNRAACSLELSDFNSSVVDCTALLDSDNSHVKALYRRAKALEALGRYAPALNDVRRYCSDMLTLRNTRLKLLAHIPIHHFHTQAVDARPKKQNRPYSGSSCALQANGRCYPGM
jgi:hypothetical protein